MLSQDHTMNRSWAEIDLDAIRQNVRALRSHVWKNTEIMAVVKADAYGHGALGIADTLLQNGASRLAVATLEEGLDLRRHGVQAPILILGYTDPARAQDVVKYQLAQTLYTRELAEALERSAAYLGRITDVHLAVDTGMSRLGLPYGPEGLDFVRFVQNLNHLNVEGAYTHFATADEDKADYIRLQFARFMSFCERVEKLGLRIPLRHCCNSAATLRFPEMHLDMVRAGLLLYGYLPEHCEAYARDFRPALSLKAKLIRVTTVEPGMGVSYNRRYVCAEPTRVATVPIGYADGYSRAMSGKADVLIAGQRCPILGNICMDTCMAAAPDNADLSVASEVVLIGTQASPNGPVSVTADDLARWSGSISYEILTAISPHIPRFYFREGRLADARPALR